MKILDVKWFNSIGIVRVEDDFLGIVYYIGTVPSDFMEEESKQHIADWGSRFPIDAGDVLFGISTIDKDFPQVRFDDPFEE